jgi:transcriptional regulator with XRE-family HTH domain
MATIRELRKRLGTVSARAGAQGRCFDSAHIVLWERYGLPPRSRATLEKIARALGVEPDELLPNAENTEGVSDA